MAVTFADLRISFSYEIRRKRLIAAGHSRSFATQRRESFLFRGLRCGLRLEFIQYCH